MSRHIARETALQMVFQMDVGSNSQEMALLTLNESDLNEHTREFTLALASGVTDRRDGLDLLISKYSKDWELDRIANVEKNILRMAIYELVHTATPPEIVLNEALELVKKYGDPMMTSFVNGVLNAVWKGELSGSVDS